jgi:hypothetical protein
MVKKRALSVTGILAASCAFSALILRIARPMVSGGGDFLILAVLGTVFIGLAVLVRAGYRSRTHVAVKTLLVVTLVAADLGVFAVLLFELSSLAWPSGQTADGDFAVKSWHVDFMGHSGSSRALYFKGALVTDRLGGYVHHPARPEVVVYQEFEDPYENNSTYVFDGRTSRTLHAGPLASLPEPQQWSPDQAKLTMTLLDELYLVDLVRWRAARLTGTASPPPEPHAMGLGSWSPDSRHFAVIDYGRRSIHGWSGGVLLQEWDAETYSMRTVGCMPDGPDRRAWLTMDYAWQDGSLTVTDEGARRARCAAIPQ